MVCQKCGSILEEEALFCKECGTMIQSVQTQDALEENPEYMPENTETKSGGMRCPYCGNHTLYWAILQYDEDVLDEIFYEYY